MAHGSSMTISTFRLVRGSMFSRITTIRERGAMGGDQWNGIAKRLSQSTALGKPIIAGETGLIAGTAPGCMSDATRDASFVAKEQAQLHGGASGNVLL